MAKIFDPNHHTFASVPSESGRDIFHIVHWSMKRVWLMVYHSDQLKVAHENVGDGLTDGYDENGYHIVSVPFESCYEFHDDNEALSIMAMRDIDDEIRSYAR